MIDDEPTPDPNRLARIERALAEYLLAAEVRSYQLVTNSRSTASV